MKWHQLQREGEPEIIEQSAVVSKLFEKDLQLISNSRENSVIFFSSEDTQQCMVIDILTILEKEN